MLMFSTGDYLQMGQKIGDIPNNNIVDTETNTNT